MNLHVAAFLILATAPTMANTLQTAGHGAVQAGVTGDGSSAAASRSSSHSRATGRAGGAATGGAATTGSSSANVTTGGGTRTAPDIVLPSLGGGGMDCPVVGFGAGGAGFSGGGGIGPTWISGDCNARKLASMLWDIGYPEQAIQLLRAHFREVDDAFKAAPVPPAAVWVAPAWCSQATARERAANVSCVGR